MFRKWASGQFERKSTVGATAGAVVDRDRLGPVGQGERGAAVLVVAVTDELGERALPGLLGSLEDDSVDVITAVPVSMAVGVGVPWT